MAKRDKSGRFLPGTDGGPGRPTRQGEADYLRMLTDGVSAQDWQKIVSRAVKDAVKGDYRARAWIGDYLLGKPVQTIKLAAADQALLSELLDRMEAQGVSASAVFNAMLLQLAESEPDER